MNRYTRSFVIITSLVLLVIPVVACAKPAPAQFEIFSLIVTPQEVFAGETVNVSAQVKNIGGSEGTYTVVLSVDGVELERKDIAVLPEATEAVSFTTIKDKAGTYTITVSELTTTLIVKPKLVAKEVELKYDDGTAEEAPKGGVQFGHLVDFLSPGDPFTIRKILVFGLKLDGESKGKTFDMQIWDKDQKVLYKEAYPADKFPLGSIQPWPEMKRVLEWVELEVPDIQVSGKFYVYVWTDAPVFHGIHIGADNSVVNVHSTAVVPSNGLYKEAEPWPLICPNPTHWWHDKSKVNWMIRVVGTTMALEE
ncbi:MAG: hypothetical protein JSV54_07790 [Chloroflexota bacterium]|nr:MAG: hypothetical protein JSV54_07790 [Chloroflexota bacterium]